MVKLYYFDLFARAEPMRMALWKAGVEYEDIRVTGQSWTDFKKESEFGQIPVLELDDGTRLSQSRAILNYLGSTYKLVSDDIMENYKGEKAANYFMGDYLMKYVVPSMFAPEEKRADLNKTLLETHIPKMLNDISSKCLGDTKFLCGE